MVNFVDRNLFENTLSENKNKQRSYLKAVRCIRWGPGEPGEEQDPEELDQLNPWYPPLQGYLYLITLEPRVE